MAFDTKRLYSALQNTGLQNKDPALHQVIYQLIGALTSVIGVVASGGGGSSFPNVVSEINNTYLISGGESDGGGDSDVVPGPPGIQGITGATGQQGGILGIIFEEPEENNQYPPIVGPQGNPGSTGAQGPVGPVVYPNDGDDGETGFIVLSTPVAGAASGLVFLQGLDASASATLDFTSWYSSLYDEYEIHLVGLVPSNNGVALRLQMSINGGATWDSTPGNYSWAFLAFDLAGPGYSGSNSDTAISILDNMNNASKLSHSGTAKLFNAGSTSLYKLIIGIFNPTDSGRTTQSLGYEHASKYLVDASAVNGLRFAPSAGTLISGSIRIYGVSKI